MAKSKSNRKNPDASAATVGYGAQFWQMAEALRGSMDAAEDPNEHRSQNFFGTSLAARWAHLKDLERWEHL